MVRANLQNSKDCSDDAYHIGGEIDSRPMSMSSNDEVGARIPTVSSPTESKNVANLCSIAPCRISPSCTLPLVSKSTQTPTTSQTRISVRSSPSPLAKDF